MGTGLTVVFQETSGASAVLQRVYAGFLLADSGGGVQR